MGEGFSPPTEQMLFPIYQESPILTSPKADSQFYLGERPPMGLIPISQARSKKHYPGLTRPLGERNTPLKLTLEKIRLGFFRRVERFVVCFHCRSLFPKVAVMFMQPS